MSKSKMHPDIQSLYGRRIRWFRKRKREEARRVRAVLSRLALEAEYTPAASDIRDMQILLDRIQMDLSQKRWGK